MERNVGLERLYRDAIYMHFINEGYSKKRAELMLMKYICSNDF